MNYIIQDYGKTVTPKLHINALQGHQYIPQADQCIKNIVQKFCTNKPFPSREYILDVGCGPGRITSDLGLPHCHRIGLDISQDFINYAWTSFLNRNKGTDPCVSFQQMNFAEEADIMLASGKIIKDFDIILMQGVMHHVHGDDRAKFLQRSFELLKPDGILIIGDEFIKDYETEDERILNVAKFYLHIIDEARKGGFIELAEEEAKNLVDDCFSGTKYAGCATQKTFEHIYEYARMINQMFCEYGGIGGLNFEANNQIRNMFDYIKRSVEGILDAQAENFNRGDLKVSTRVFTEELTNYGFVLEEKYEIGPVKQLGGMGVLMFMKR